MGRAISGFAFLASAKLCSVLGLNESTGTLWSLFGLDLDVTVGWRCFRLGERRLQEVDTMRFMDWDRALVLRVFGNIDRDDHVRES